VCCVIKITSGGSSSYNNTYITIASDITAGTHVYKICPCSDDICRIKFDFTTFQLAAPDSGFGFEAHGSEAAANAVNVGKCMDDTFSINSPSGRNSPVICGNNKNQHMILDAAGSECMTVHVGIGSGTITDTRSVSITVYQYTCGDEMGGPPGCLQYFTNESGKIRSFNFPDYAPGAVIPVGGLHLHDQHYKICIRRGNGKEINCYIPCTAIVGVSGNTAGNVPTNQGSFGLSPTEAENVAKSFVDTDCSTDYIWMKPGNAISTQFTTAIDLQNSIITTFHPTRFCGRYFGSTAGGAVFIDASICSYGLPFEVGVEFDEKDVCSSNTGTDGCESVVETAEANKPGGSGNLGFSLCYKQHTNT